METPEVVVIGLPATTSDQLATALRQLRGDVRVVVLRVSEADTALGSDPQTAAGATMGQLFGWLDRADVVSIAVFEADPTPELLAVGLSCDVRISSETVRFQVGSSVVSLLQPGIVASLVEHAGRGMAASMLLAGRIVTAHQAHAAGLVQELFGAGQADTAVAARVEAVLAIPRDTSAELKALLRRREGRRPAWLAAETEARDRLAAGAVVGAG